MSFSLLSFIALVISFVGLFSLRKYVSTNLDLTNQWIVGGIILIINMFIISITALTLWKFHIPYAMPLIMIGSPVVSVFAWIYIRASFKKGVGHRLFSILLGQSVYILLFFYFFYKDQHLIPLYPGEDTFMRELGLVVGMVVCACATFLGVLIFLLPNKNR